MDGAGADSVQTGLSRPAVCMDALQLGFAALGNDVPTKAVVVLDLTPKRLFPLLGGHESGACSKPPEQFLEQNSSSKPRPAVARQQKSGLTTAQKPVLK